MEKIHAVTIARRPALPMLASPLRTMRRLPQPRARVRLEGALGLFTAPPHGLVLLKSLSGLLLTQGEGIHRHG